MKTYKAYFHSDLQYAIEELEADTPDQALELARRFATDDWDSLDLGFYEPSDCPINEIEICDEDGNGLVTWLDEDMRLQLAARDLLDAGQRVVDRWERGDLAEAVRELAAAVAKAKGGAG